MTTSTSRPRTDTERTSPEGFSLRAFLGALHAPGRIDPANRAWSSLPEGCRPLVALGPGGTHRTEYLANGRSLTAVHRVLAHSEGAALERGTVAARSLSARFVSLARAPRTLFDRLLGIRRLELPVAGAPRRSVPFASGIDRPAPTIDGRGDARIPAVVPVGADSLQSAADGTPRPEGCLRQDERPLNDDARPHHRLIEPTETATTPHGIAMPERSFRESDPEAGRDLPNDQGCTPDGRLFADDAGTRRRTRRQQGHRVRARRSPGEEGRLDTRQEQGTLFVDR